MIFPVKTPKHRIILSLRGTQSMIDVLYDLDIEPVPYQDGFIHKGMLTGARNIISSVGHDIDHLVKDYPKYKLIATGISLFFFLSSLGHSLGGGFASIFGLLEKARYPHLQCYCYAPPSCMSDTLAEQLEPYVFSIINNYDVVPRINTKALHQYKEELEKLDLNTLRVSLFHFFILLHRM